MLKFRYRQKEVNRKRNAGGCGSCQGCSQNCFARGATEATTLDHLKPGESAVICSLGCEGALRRRLLDMGLTPNTPVMVRKVAPLGDPIELYLRNYELTLRKEDASLIRIRDSETGEDSRSGHEVRR